jgi:hypothetical protein
MSRELLKQCLDLITDLDKEGLILESGLIFALRDELAKPEQEPVAWMLPDYGDVLSASEADGTGIYNIPLYTAPPSKQWVGLTDEEINDFDKKLRDNGDYCSLHFAWGISAKLKEKNT